MTLPLFDRLLSIGVGPWLTVQERQHVRFLNGGFGLASLMGVVLGGASLLLLDQRTADWGPFVGAIIGALTLWLQHKRCYVAANNVAYLGTIGFVSAATLALPQTHGVRIYLLVVALASFMLPRPRREQDLYFAIGGALFVGMDWFLYQNLYTLAHFSIALGIVYVLGSLFRSEHAKVVASLSERDEAISLQNERLTDLNRALQDLLHTSEEQARRLDELNAVKDRVVTVLSHDLRSPLGSVDALLGAYDEGVFSPEDLRDLMADTRRSVASTREQLEDVLAWARLLLGGTDTDARIVLEGAVVRTVAQVEDRAASKGIALRVSVSPGLVVVAESASVLLLLRNLLSNALKFTPQGGTVAVEARLAGEGAVLRISDTGMGIPADRLADLNGGQVAHITTLGTDGEKGSGLGLALCREVAHLFGGRLRVESTEGEGTTVVVTFPAAEDVPEGTYA